MNRRRGSITVVAVLLAVAIWARWACGCSAFLASDGQVVLFGNNEDFWNPATRMWTVPAVGQQYGRLYFGYDDLVPQGGMNEAGLVYDGFAKKPKPVVTSRDRPVFQGNLIDHAMATCGTVSEVTALFGRYNLELMESYNLMFADAGGNAIIIEGDHIVPKIGTFQVVTNFDLSEHPDGANAYGEGDSCARFQIASEMLAATKSPTVERMREVLAAVHAEGRSRTLYSNVYDLKRRVVHLYHYHDFAHEVVIDLARELRKGRHVVKLPSLFPRNFAYEAFLKEQGEALEKRRAERSSVDLPLATLARYVGTYQGPDGMLTVTLEGSSLFAGYAAFERAALSASSENAFFLLRHTYDVDLAFQLGGAGEVTGVKIRTGEQEMTFPRIQWKLPGAEDSPPRTENE